MENRLGTQPSPYLQQHASDPVSWQPWDDTAFDLAQKLNRPILLSIGYSSCHWCHVMQRESFKDNTIASLINNHFVPIKVDRETRPDVDHAYMSACVQLTGAGGWPLTAFLTPDGKPFFIGTYFPPQTKYDRPGFVDVVKQIASKWNTDRARLSDLGSELTANLTKTQPTTGELSSATFAQGSHQLLAQHDHDYGGFGSAPKFPMAPALLFCLRRLHRQDESMKPIIERTLAGMYRGGIFDHIGHGFFRYSTDDRWHLPHFEKMLYDNALLAQVYTHAYQLLNHELFARVAHATLDYLARDLRSEHGPFYSAQDAEADGIEGGHILLTKHELDLTPATKRLLEIFNIDDEQPTVPNLLPVPIDSADLLSGNVPPSDLEPARIDLVKHRLSGPLPKRDEKIIAGWNGLAISAFAIAARTFSRSDYLTIATSATDFILTTMYDQHGLVSTWYREQKGHTAFCSDYASLAKACFDLYQASFDTIHLDRAVTLTDELLDRFYTDHQLKTSSQPDPRIPLHEPDLDDGALPSTTSLTLSVLIKASRYTGRQKYHDIASDLIASISGTISRSPASFPYCLLAADDLRSEQKTLVIAGDKNSTTFASMILAANRYDPDLTTLAADPKDEQITDIAPVTKHRKPSNGHVQAFLCQANTCTEPMTNPATLKRLLT